MRRLALVWVCCLIGLVGCSKPDQPGSLPPKPTVSVSVSATASAQPKDPKAAVVALVRAYYLERNHALNTGDTKKLLSLTTPDCRCRTTDKNIESHWRTGRIEALNYYVINEVSFSAFASDSAADINVSYSLNQEAIFDSSGKRIEFYPADPKPHSALIECRLVSGLWRVANVVRL